MHTAGATLNKEVGMHHRDKSRAAGERTLAATVEQFNEFTRTHSIAEVLSAIEDPGAFSGDARRAASLWLKSRSDEAVSRDRAAKEAEERDLRRREVSAAERAALAAKKSARSAAFAIGVSLAALAISAWPHVKAWL